MEDKYLQENHSMALYTEFTIVNAHFSAIYYCKKEEEKGIVKVHHLIKAAWDNSRDKSFELSSLAQYFGIIIPEFINAIKLLSVSLSYYMDDSRVKFEIDSNYAKFAMDSMVVENKRTCGIELSFKDLTFYFDKLPVVGSLVQGNDRFCMDSFRFDYIPSKGQVSSTSFKLNFALFISGHEFYFGEKPKGFNDLESNKSVISCGNDSESGEVKWVDINKSFKVLHFDKIGVSFDGNSITVYLNAGFTIVGLEVDFYGLYLTIPLAREKSFGFGLNGLAVAFSKDPLMIAGGLYHILDKERKDLYNGALMLKFSKYGFSALGSYCDNYGQPSFFLYLMLSAPLGGPPYFFVTGLALGMGINRGVRLPDIKSVGRFPFVAAAVGKGGSKLNPGSDIGMMLTELSDWIYPSNGEFFLTAGLKFITCGILETFALLTIEFGNRLLFNLLGMAEASIPPNIAKTGPCPIAYAQLAIKVTVDIAGGYAEVLASLTDESYILDKNCKLTGGFGLCVWFAGERAGDFFVSLGGCHHPLFINKDEKGNTLYPELDKVGINWKINNNLKFTAGAYFALTPSCIMAGANLSLTYQAGNLKAWLNAATNFLLKWKPFFYSAEVHISVGASYRIKIFGIRKTFSVELGASASFWGPEFSGKVRIKWFIISFTISFGHGAKKNDPIKWDDFSSSFLDDRQNKNMLQIGENSSNKAVNKINVSEGLLKIEKINEKEVYCVNSDKMIILTGSSMPCTEIIIISGKQKKELEKYKGKLGVVPMGVKEYLSTLTVALTRYGQPAVLDDFEVSIEYGNFAPALWKNENPGINDVKPIKAPTGVKISAKKHEITGILPHKGSYNMETLLENEPIQKSFQWIKEDLPKGSDYSKYKDDQILTKISETIVKNTVRDDIHKLLKKEFKLTDSVKIEGIGKEPKNYFMAYPWLRTTGAQYGGMEELD